MTRVHGVLLVVLCAAGCAVASDETTPSDAATHEDLGGALMIDLASGEEPEPDICELLPACGPCSLACDPDALAETLPPETCAVLVCTLTNGQRVHVHACNRG